MTPETVLAYHDAAALWPAADRQGQYLSGLAPAYASALAVRALREARGERVAGYKIGFTNRTIWERYKVFAPIWGPVYDTTLSHCDGSGVIDLTGTLQPRLEPEIAFGIASTPPADASLDQLFDCVEWLAPSFEVVQTHCADWKFTAAETVLDGALHARLLVGRRTPVRDLAANGSELDAKLAAASVRLFRGDELIDEGVGANVLDGPLHALLHFVREMQACPGAPGLVSGDVVTTGTWTDAWPLEPGQTWRSEFDAPFDSLRIALR